MQMALQRGTGCPQLPPPFIGVHKVVDLAIFSVKTHCEKGLRSLCGRCSTPQSLIEGTSASGFGLSRPCWQPHQMTLSASFLPWSAACRNTLWRMMDEWGLSISNLGYSSKNSLASRCQSAYWIDSPVSLTCSLVD